MVEHFWEKQQSIARKILVKDIKHYEDLGQGNVTQKKKRNLQTLIRNTELLKEKIKEKEKKRDLNA